MCWEAQAMVASKTAIFPSSERLTYEVACRLADSASRSKAQTVILDLTQSFDASTSAFARLVLLRRELLQVGRDIWIAGLQSRAARLFEVHRLEGILPRLSDVPSIPVTPRATRPVLAGRAVRRRCMLAGSC
jgi:anti-anti-sigma regulatory factor